MNIFVSGASQHFKPAQLKEDKCSEEKWYTIFIQVLLPFLIAGFGMVAAGVVLDSVQVIKLAFE